VAHGIGRSGDWHATRSARITMRARANPMRCCIMPCSSLGLRRLVTLRREANSRVRKSHHDISASLPRACSALGRNSPAVGPCCRKHGCRTVNDSTPPRPPAIDFACCCVPAGRLPLASSSPACHPPPTDLRLARLDSRDQARRLLADGPPRPRPACGCSPATASTGPGASR
jgi:hypothetical protein